MKIKEWHVLLLILCTILVIIKAANDYNNKHRDKLEDDLLQEVSLIEHYT